MSLRVWLPLTKDLRNQGLSNVTVTNYGATLDNNGKLGKCYLFDGTDDAIGIGDLNNICPDGNFSFACWFYKSEFSSKGYDTIFGGPSGFELETKNGTTNSNVIVPWNWGKPQIAYEFDKWYHLVMTRTSSGTTYYLNGEQVATGTAGTIPAGNYFIGAWNTATQQNYKGKLNDVRIYDHCLSPMEIKWLSQGLVLHYPLNDKSIESTTNLNTKINMNNSTNSVWGGHSTTTTTYDCTNEPVPFNSGNKIEITYPVGGNTGGGTSVNLGVNIPVSSSTTYTLSVYLKASDNFNYWTANFLYYYGDTAGHGIFNINNKEYITDGWYRIWGTLTTGSSQTSLNPYFYSYPSGNRTYYIGGWQLEQKNHMTPFVSPGGSRNNSIIYDCSGFCNNGTKTGTFTWTSDTPKYSISTKFNGAEKISANSLPLEVQSVSFWVKVSTIPSGYGICYVDSNTQTSIGFYNGNSFITSCAVSANVVLLGTTFKANEWNHIVLVKTGANTRNVYCNGILLTNSGTNSWVHNGSNLSLGWRDYASGNAGWFNGQLCDFRAYATALSADDVKSLYQNSAYIDSSGNVYGAVHSEG